MRALGLMFYMDQDLEIDVARVISNEMKNMVLSGIRTTPLKPQCNLGFPGLIMGLIGNTRMTLPQQVPHNTGTIDDVHAKRYCRI
ncbi:hypothetical protein A2U01_0060367, partial [Trifolium medium]|nr:hypothetical protein [Trifolium medium]